MEDNKNKQNMSGGMYMGPMVYFGTYPMPLPMWQQMCMGTFPQGMNIGQDMRGSAAAKQFMLPYPEDDNEE